MRRGAPVHGRDLGPRALVAAATALVVAGAAVLALASSPLRFAFAAPLLLTALLCGLQAARPSPIRVKTDDRGIEVITVEGRPARRLAMAQIGGIRVIRGGRGGTPASVRLEPTDPAVEPLEIPWPLIDDAFWGWARALPDLDARDTAREASELLASPALGATPALREAAMRRARSVARLLNWTSIAAGGWALAAPSSPWAVGAAFLYPAMALVVALSGRGAYRLFKTRNDPRPTLWMALVLPALLASIRVFEYQLVTPRALMVPALACGAALTALAAAGDRSLLRSPLQLAGVLALMTGVSASGAAFANCVRDASDVSEYEARLLGTGHTRRTPWLKLGPWGRRAGVTTVFVPRGIYESVEACKPVRVCLREGRLGLAWFWVSPGQACADSRPPTM